MTDVNGKVWGLTSKIFSKNNVELYRIVGKKNGKSSTHRHKAKWSMFFVERGKILVAIEKEYGKSKKIVIDKTILTAGNSTIIKPNEYHYFKILQNDTVCYEIYWAILDSEDIDRKDHGTIDN